MMEKARQAALWLGRELDAVIALAVAIAAGALGVLDVTSTQVAINAILATLAVLAIALLRDRERRETSDNAMVSALERLSREIAEATGRMNAIAPTADLLAGARQALADHNAMSILSGAEVGRAHTTAREHTEMWMFKGGTGTFTRAVTLPAICKAARLERRLLKIRLEIVDPTDESVCDRYARFRRSVSTGPDGTGEEWTSDRVHQESYATILAACWYQERSHLLDVRVGLSATMSTFRYDMATSGLIITQDDARLPAVLVPRRSHLYESYETELVTSFEQARQVRLEKIKSLSLGDEPSVDEVVSLFTALGLPLLLDPQQIPKMIEKALHARNPYQ